MTVHAPLSRRVDQFGKSPTVFFQALSDADDQITKAALAQADVDDATSTARLLIEERDRLAAECRELRAQLAAARAMGVTAQ